MSACLTVIAFALIAENPSALQFHPTVSFRADEASQAVAVDEHHFYAVASARIGKYDRSTHEKVALWKADKQNPLTHLNSGVVLDGKLYCAHSNFPKIPMKSSIEIWNAETLEHVQSIELPDAPGSFTWIDRHDDAWWLCFAHYDGNGGADEKDHTDTVLTLYDDNFRLQKQWKFPHEVLKRFKPSSCSGGLWGPKGLLFCTGHDRPEVYVLKVPQDADANRLELVDILSVPIAGQGIAWNASKSELFGIRRRTLEIVGGTVK